MIITWMAYAMLLGVFAALAAEALHRAARTFGRPSRFIWLAGMLVTMLAPVLGYLVARWHAVHSNDFMTIGGPLAPGRLQTNWISLKLDQPTGLMRLLAIWNSAATGTDRIVLGVWALLTLAMLGRLVVATAGLWRRRAQWRCAMVQDVP